ncbi:class I SAM-dependent methyltransferase [Nocardioides cavernae]|uniref:Class I SAM-dependent methyltransferase n=1 Tax=Nocardioides cavernae TaxID=1921566 RepID=A0ABR8NBU7_9ACTN|nr:class I SAM-dependent methyltransferase [Nocardioides cavernae]MBD3925330.1 class I SAM-dependent methyltransferase [Nocardioides cavernae]MBM7514291.1 SAM-dependent methyltransferase [Nocardioides cavernae]
MTSRALSFGSVAAAYERFRPGYPGALVDAVLAYAGGPVATALEIGAGTGKATRVFAARGLAVTATEPDAAMLAELERHVPDSVRTVRATFEELPLTSTYDLVYAAAALHWTRAEGRWERAAKLLEPGGVLASFGGPLDLADPGLEDAVRCARAPWLADDDVPSPDGTPDSAAMQWPGTELSRSELFTDVRQVELDRRTTVSALDYVGLLSTVSAYLELPPIDREAAFGRILAVLPPQVDVVGDITLHLARLASDG